MIVKPRPCALVATCLALSACNPEKPPVARGASQPTGFISAPHPATLPGTISASALPVSRWPQDLEVAPQPTTNSTGVAVPADPAADKPVFNAEVLRLRLAAQVRILGQDNYLEDARGNRHPSVNEIASTLDGYTLGSYVSVENEGALATFHEQLERLATGRDSDGKVRILVYGASHTQGDLFTSYMRYYLQSRFGNGGLGFVPLAKLNSWHRMLDATLEENGFKTQHSQLNNTPANGFLGLLGAAAYGSAKAAATRIIPKNNTDPDLSATNYEVSYNADRGAGDLLLFVNEVPRIQLSGKASAPEDRFFKFNMAPGWHQIEVRPAGNGTARVYGVTIERPEPGIVVDTLGIGGARAASMLSWDEAAWTAQVRRRDPALYMLAYGTNEATDSKESIEVYRTKLTAVMDRFERALPGVSCLLVGPFDFPKETPQGYMTRARLLEVIETQRAVARERGCAFWDGYRFMGGAGSMHEWVRANPSFASPDHIHLNARGYVRMGMSLTDALMRSYDDFHLVRDLPPPPKAPVAPPALNARLSAP